MIDAGSLIIIIAFMLISWVVGARLKAKFKKFSKIPIDGGLSGAEIAKKMLDENGISGVKISSVQGQLTDHYNPVTKTVNLSPEVYSGRSVAAAAVAAHECGHAIQHANAYSMLKLRSALVPLQNVTAKIMNFIFIALFFGSFILKGLLPMDVALMIIIACYGVFTLFAFVTLPVEINASQRALVWLSASGITRSGTHEYAKNALKWAAYTYVVAALSSLAMLLYYLFLLLGRRN